MLLVQQTVLDNGDVNKVYLNQTTHQYHMVTERKFGIQTMIIGTGETKPNNKLLLLIEA